MDDTAMAGGHAGQYTAAAGPPPANLDFRALAETVPHMIWSARADGYNDYFNARMLAYLGRPLEALLGANWLEIIHPDDRPHVVAAWEAAFARGTEYRVDYRLRRADGTYCWHEGRAMPLLDAAGRIARWFGTCTEISARKEAEEKYRRFATFTSDFVHMCTRKGSEPYHFEWIDGAYSPACGYSFNDLFALECFLPLVHPDDHQTVADALMSLRPGDRKAMEFRILAKDNTVRWVVQQSHCEAGPSAGELLLYGTLTDITERKQMESQLHASETRLRALYTSMRDAFVSVDMHGRLLEFNPAYRELLGYAEDELWGKTYVDLTPAKWHALEAKIVAEQVLPRGFSDLYEKEYVRKDGTLVPIELRTELVRSADGEPAQMWAIIRDITERKRTEEALLEREQRLNFYVDNSPMATLEWDADFVITRWSAEAEKIFGWTAAETIGKAIMALNIIYAEDILLVEKVMADLLGGTNKYVLSANRNCTKDGRVISCEWFNTILRDLQGEMVAVLSQVMDVTERKRTEAEREQYFHFFSASPDLLCVAGADGYFRKINPSFARVLGHAEQDLLARPFLDCVHPDDRPETREMMKKVQSDNEAISNFQNRYLCSDGSYRWLSWNAYFREEDQIYFGLARDVTEQKLIGEALLQSEQRYRAIVESQTEYVSRFLPDGVLTYVNPALASWYGAKPEDLVGRSFYPFLQEQDIEEVTRKIESLTCNGPAVTLELSIPSSNGELRWQQWTDHAICDERGHIVEYQGVGRDITEKKEAELFLARAKETLELQVTERTASLTLANERLNREIEERRRIEQDLRNYQRQLEAMSLEVSLAADRERARIAGELHDEVGQRLMLSRIKLDALATLCDETGHGQVLRELQELVDQTITDIRSLTFQLRPPLLASAGLVAAVQWLGEELKQNYGLGIEIRYDANPTDFPYEIKAAIFQVIRELLLNVAKHADTDRAIVYFKSAANALTIVVEDYGVGFDIVSVIAEHGTPEGFGLFNTRQRIQHLGGRLDVDSLPGKGSRATISVPLALVTTRSRV